MSEYQYYEFLAQDRSLSPEEQQELRAISTRAKISSNSFQNEYSWGDLKADPRDLVRRYFDVHVYLANWGDRRVLVRLPQDTLSADEIELWSGEYGLEIETDGQWMLVNFYVTERYEDTWIEGEGWMAQIAPMRQRLTRGDRRPLYVAWLASTQSGERDWEDEALEPPVPRGLQELPPDCVALGEFLGLDRDLLAAGAAGSLPQTAAAIDSDAEWRAWLGQQAIARRDEWLIKLLRDDDAGALRAKILGQFLKETQRSEAPAPAQRRYLGELRQLAADLGKERARQERQLEAERQAQQRAKMAAERELRLTLLQGNAQDAWARVEARVAEKSDRAYREAAQLIGDLQELAKRQQQLPVFESALRACTEKHRRKRSFIRHLQQKGLGG